MNKAREISLDNGNNNNNTVVVYEGDFSEDKYKSVVEDE